MQLLRRLGRRIWGAPVDRLRRFLNPPEPTPAVPPLADVAGLMAAVREETDRSRDRAGPRTTLPNPVILDTTFPDVEAALLQATANTDTGARLPPIQGTSVWRRQLFRLVVAVVHRLSQHMTRPQRAFNRAVLFVLNRFQHGQEHQEAAHIRLVERVKRLEDLLIRQAGRISDLERRLDSRNGGCRPC